LKRVVLTVRLRACAHPHTEARAHAHTHRRTRKLALSAFGYPYATIAHLLRWLPLAGATTLSHVVVVRSTVANGSPAAQRHAERRSGTNSPTLRVLTSTRASLAKEDSSFLELDAAVGMTLSGISNAFRSSVDGRSPLGKRPIAKKGCLLGSFGKLWVLDAWWAALAVLSARATLFVADL